MPLQLIKIVIILCIILLVFYWLRWMIRTRKKGKKGLFYLVLITSILFISGITWFLEIFPGSKYYFDQKELLALTGKSLSFKSVYSYHSKRSFLGDGYSIEILQIEEKDLEYFRNPPSPLSNERKANRFRKDWQFKNWKKGPLDSTDQRCFDFALTFVQPISRAKQQELKNWFEEMKKTAVTTECSYSYDYLTHDNHHITNIDLYFIDLKDGYFYIINFNT